MKSSSALFAFTLILAAPMVGFASESQHAVDNLMVLEPFFWVCAIGVLGVVGFEFSRSPKVQKHALPDVHRTTKKFRCPACPCTEPKNTEPYRQDARDATRPLVAAERFSWLGIVRCLECGGLFTLDGQPAPTELRGALAAMGDVIQRMRNGSQVVDAHSTASERAHFLKEAFEERALVDDDTFAATRRHLAEHYGQTEPEARNEHADDSTWTGIVPRRGLIGASKISIDDSLIRFDRVRIPVVDARYFTIRPNPGPGMWALRCVDASFEHPMQPPAKGVWKVPSTQDEGHLIVHVDDTQLAALRMLVVEMEGKMGWLIRTASDDTLHA